MKQFINKNKKIIVLRSFIPFFVVFILLACFKCETESKYRLYVNNATADTLIMAVTAETDYGRYYHYYVLPSKEPYLIENRGGRKPDSYSIEEIIREIVNFFYIF